MPWYSKRKFLEFESSTITDCSPTIKIIFLHWRIWFHTIFDEIYEIYDSFSFLIRWDKSTRRGRLIHSHQLFRDACLTSTFNLLCGQPISCHWTENGRRSPRFQRLTIRGATRVILAFGWVNLDPFDSPVPRLASREFSGGDDDKSEFVAGKWSRFNDEEDGDIIAIIRIACFMYNDRSIDDVSPFNGYYSWKIIVSRNVVEFISDECISYSDSAPLNCDR